MKGARFILPGCTGFHRLHPDLGEFKVTRLQHYKVVCLPLDLAQPQIETYIPMRDFIVLNYPRPPDE
jgi:hypothetical protein